MRRTLLGLLITAGMILSGGQARAHHSYSAVYYEDRTEKIEGDVVQFHYQNPHTFLQVEAPDDKGVTQRWMVEWVASWQLSRKGVDRGTLKPGDHVIIVGKPGRNAAEHRMHLMQITRPADGWKWAANPD